jgi:hypothetical protein
MKFYLVIITILFVGCSKNAFDKIRQESELLKTFHLKNKFLIDNDTIGLKSIFHTSVDFCHSNCWSEDFISITTKDTTLLDYKAIIIKEQSVKIVENVGIVRGKGDYTIRYKGSDMVIPLCFVETYILSKYRWLLLTRQSSKIQ